MAKSTNKLSDKAPSIGEKAPDFTVTDDTGRKVKLSDFRGKKIVLYFYPKDDTPG
jgi:peroxiredoxin Q/BCP